MDVGCVRLSVPVAALMAFGCASRPDAELADARAALDAAVAAEAPLYAAPEFQTSEQAFEAAKAEVAAQDHAFPIGRNYREALELIAMARAGAEAATAVVHENRDEVRRQAETAIDEARQSVDLALLALAEISPEPRNRILIEGLEIELSAVRNAVDEAREKLKAGRFMDALKQSRSAALRTGSIHEKIRSVRTV